MRRVLTLLSLLVTFALSAQSRIEGRWLGTLDLGAQKLRLSVTVTRSGETMAPVALETIAEWISRVTTSRSSAPARPD